MKALEVTLLNLLNPSKPTTIEHSVGISRPIRGFFRVDYEYSDPTGMLG